MKAAPFIVGVGRSGTTLLRLMLDAHPNLAIPSETHFLAALLESPPTNNQDFLAVLKSIHTWSDFHIPEVELMRRLDTIDNFNLAQAVRVFYQSYADRFGKSRWGDKSPPYVQFIEPLGDLLPEAVFIHIIRDGRDVALSYRDKWFGPSGQGIDGAALFWKKTIEQARQQSLQLSGPGRYLEVHFEDLVRSPAEILSRVCQLLDLAWDKSVLDYYRRAEDRLQEMSDRRDGQGRIVVSRQKRVSIHQHTHHPPDSGQIGKWRNGLNQSEIEKFHVIAGDLLQELAYDV